MDPQEVIELPTMARVFPLSYWFVKTGKSCSSNGTCGSSAKTDRLLSEICHLSAGFNSQLTGAKCSSWNVFFFWLWLQAKAGVISGSNDNGYKYSALISCGPVKKHIHTGSSW